MGTGEFKAGGNPATDWHPIQGGVALFLTGIGSSLMGHLGSYADFTFFFTQHSRLMLISCLLSAF